MPLKNMFSQQKQKLTGSILQAVTIGITVSILLVLVDQLSLRFGFTGVPRLADDLLGGIIAGIIIYLDNRRRNRYFAGRLQAIALMNHHVRNSLQAIKFAHQTGQELQFIDQAVARIEWALREILPGEINGGETVFPPNSSRREEATTEDRSKRAS